MKKDEVQKDIDKFYYRVLKNNIQSTQPIKPVIPEEENRFYSDDEKPLQEFIEEKFIIPLPEKFEDITPLEPPGVPLDFPDARNKATEQ